MVTQILSPSPKGEGWGEGLDRGMVEDENPLKTMIQDANAGLVLGSAGGVAAGNVEKFVRGKLLKKQTNINKARTGAIGYYDDYLLGTSTKRNKNSTIEFGKRGIKKTKNTSADIRKLQSIPDLPKLIRDGEIEGSLNPNKISAKYDKYHYIKNEEYMLNNKKFPNRITIGEDANGKHFYNINDIEYPSALQNRNSVPLLGEQILDKTEPLKIIPQTPQAINSNLENITKKPSVFGDWLEELKRKRRLKGW